MFWVMVNRYAVTNLLGIQGVLSPFNILVLTYSMSFRSNKCYYTNNDNRA